MHPNLLRLKNKFSFEEAKEWYLAEGRNATFRAMLEKGENRTFCETFLRQKVQEAIALVPAPKPQQEKKKEPFFPAALKPLWAERQQLLAKCRDLHTRLDDMEEPEAAEAALWIARTMQEQVLPIQQRVEHWRDTGEIILGNEEVAESLGSLGVQEKVKRRNALRVYLSRVKNGKRTAPAEKIEGWNKELQQIEEELKAWDS